MAADGRLHNLVCMHKPEGKKRWIYVYVTDHTFMGGYNRVSNWVTYRRIRADGSLGAEGAYYDYGKENFRVCKNMKAVTTITFKRQGRK